MLKRGVKEPLNWSDASEVSFSRLKDKLCHAPILRLPDPSKVFVVRSDASDSALGAVLLQYHGDVPHPVAYASRKLLARKIKYSTIERELLALVFAVRKFKYYLIGQSFMIEVDHKPLVYLKKFKDQNPRLMRWALSL